MSVETDMGKEYQNDVPSPNAVLGAVLPPVFLGFRKSFFDFFLCGKN